MPRRPNHENTENAALIFRQDIDDLRRQAHNELPLDAVDRNEPATEKEEEEEGERFVGVARWNTMHWPWESGMPIPYSGTQFQAPETLQRPAFFRTLVVVSGVDAKTRRIAAEDDKVCPYCRCRFRNLYAMKLHIEQSHDALCIIENDEDQ